MSVARISRLTTTDRIAALEQRADAHDKMAQQVQELYDLYTTARTILGAMNWFWLKFAAFVGGGLGLVAVGSTIWINFGRLIGH
ncbi:hypothetical protein [Bradyrhizobium sp. 188]|uniref:hypothetical protein n=1 Tax=Bradyrhizobium sp. 188 TaxID=2782656 RepID=UPI001FF9145B|nr:hypothetical protein [Bradyrhizobium sp. 188]MCK1501514.1 hypothetical protein [Bradyrhizobium sp. 188]